MTVSLLKGINLTRV